MKRVSITIGLFLLAASASSQEGRVELLQEVGPQQAARLEEYNSVFLQRQTYYASRHRIVQADINAILNAREVSITPFPDVEPIVFELREISREGEDSIFWRGRYAKDPFVDDLRLPLAPATIQFEAWDLEPAGTAVISILNRFAFSPRWKLDQFDRPVLDGRAGEPAVVTTPPPRTPEEIATHKRLLSFQKRAFFSVSATTLDFPEYSSRYILEPLKYTPRYSVIYEIPRSTVIPVVIDRLPGEKQDPVMQAQYERYSADMARLPKEEGKEVLGDLK